MFQILYSKDCITKLYINAAGLISTFIDCYKIDEFFFYSLYHKKFNWSLRNQTIFCSLFYL